MAGLPGRAAGLTGTSGLLLSAFLGQSFLDKSAPLDMEAIHLPLSSVNVDKKLLSVWTSEELETYTEEPFNDECSFFNFSKQYTSEFCDAFTISRMQTGTLRVAEERALKCAAKAKTECILSPEIGLAVPAVFIGAPEEERGIITIIAPRVVPLPKGTNVSQKHVRVTLPSDTFATQTVVMSDATKVEYMTASKTVKSEVFLEQAAFCINLLRVAYDSTCWQQLDG